MISSLFPLSVDRVRLKPTTKRINCLLKKQRGLSRAIIEMQDLKDEIEEEVLLMNKSKEPIGKFKCDMSEFLIEIIRGVLYGHE